MSKTIKDMPEKSGSSFHRPGKGQSKVSYSTGKSTKKTWHSDILKKSPDSTLD